MKNPLSTTPNSRNAQILLDKALASDNPYLIGIAAHTYADTCSHQNFTGLREEWNAVYPWYNVFKSLVPNIGHAEAGHSPDVISEPWVDYRFGGSPIDNRERAYDAVAAIYARFQNKTKKGEAWNEVKDTLRDIIDCVDYDARIGKIVNLFETSGGIPRYDKDAWISAALDKSGEEIVMHQGFTSTDWYKFHQAAKVHFASAMEQVKDI